MYHELKSLLYRYERKNLFVFRFVSTKAVAADVILSYRLFAFCIRLLCRSGT